MKELKVHDSPEQERQEKDWLTSNQYNLLFKEKVLMLLNKR